MDESVSSILAAPGEAAGFGIKEVLDTAVAAACEVLGKDAAAIGLLDGEHVTLRSHHGLSDEFASRFRVHKHQSLTGLVFRSGQPYAASDLTYDPNDTEETARDEGIRGTLVLPLKIGGEVIGCLYVGHRSPHEFTVREIGIASAFAEQVGKTLENVCLLEQERRHRRRAETLLDVVGAANSSLGLKKVLVKLCQSVVDLSVGDRCSIYLIDEETAKLEPFMSVGVKDPALWEKFRSIGDGTSRAGVGRLVSRLRKLREPCIADDARRTTVVSRRWVKAFDLKSIAIYPLIAKDKVMGMMVVDAFRDFVHFPGEEVETLRAIANQAAVIIDNARLFEEERRQRERAALLLDVVTAANSSLSLKNILIKICQSVVDLSVGDRCSIYLIEREPPRLVPYMSLGVQDSDLWAKFQATGAEAPSGRVSRLIEGLSRLRRPYVDENVRHSRVLPSSWIETFDLKSVALYPLIVKDAVMGVMVVDAFRDYVRFPPGEVETLTAIAKQAAITIENARLFEQERRHRERVERLLEVVSAASPALSLKQVVIKICEAVLKLSVAERCSILLYNEDTWRLEPYMSLGVDDPDLWQKFQGARSVGPEEVAGLDVTSMSLWQRIQRAGGPGPGEVPGLEHLSQDLTPLIQEHVPGSGLLPDFWVDTFNIKSIAIYPLVTRDRPVGSMAVDSFRDFVQFPPEEVETLTAIAQQIAIIIDNARLYEKVQRQAITDFLTGVHNHRYLRDRLEEEVARTNRGGLVFSIMMLDLDQFALFNDTYGHPVGDAVLRNVASVIASACRATDIVGRYGGDEFMVILPQTKKTQARRLARRIQSCLAREPFSVGEEGAQVSVTVSIGIASCPEDGDRGEHLILEADGALYESKRQGGNRIFVCGRRRDGSLPSRSGAFAIIQRLASALGEKEPYGRDHNVMAVRYAGLMAETLALSDEERESLREAALLHDVGNLAVPDHVLLKPASLNTREWRLVRKHVRLSEAILRGIPELNGAAQAVMSHHERWDGGGYPRGLRGEDIPLLGRIMAVVDAYSAMTCDRPYRKALSHEDAKRELKSNAGTQFDPHLVDVFLESIEKESLTGRDDGRRHAA